MFLLEKAFSGNRKKVKDEKNVERMKINIYLKMKKEKERKKKMKTENKNDERVRKLYLGHGMGPLLVLDCSCLRENVIVTCKSVSFCVV